MDSIFSPTRSTATMLTENTPIENTARTLFKESHPMDKPKSKPLATITNNNKLRTMDTGEKNNAQLLSPSQQNVSQLKNWITKMEKENKKKSEAAWKKPTNLPLSNTSNKIKVHSRKPSAKVQEIRQRVAAVSASTPPIVKHLSSSRNVKIPLNKVEEMKKILLNYKQQQAQQKELINMSSKKRAKIEERLNRVSDIQKWLNDMERQSRNNSAPKTKELNLPLNRVQEMKNWLIEFERQNKEHYHKYNAKSGAYRDFTHQGGGAHYVPVTRNRKDNSKPENVSKPCAGASNVLVETPNKKAVRDLAQFLVDFEKKNKEHFEATQRNYKPLDKPEISKGFVMGQPKEHEEEIKEDNIIEEEKEEVGEVEVVDTTEEENEDDEEETEDTESEEDVENEEVNQDSARYIVENTSILQNENCMKDMNISMMPATNNMDQSDWDDEYDDLMKVDINIEPVQSTESWEDESFGDFVSSNDTREESNESKSDSDSSTKEDKDHLSEDLNTSYDDEDFMSSDNDEYENSHHDKDGTVDSSLSNDDNEGVTIQGKSEEEENNNDHFASFYKAETDMLIGEEILSTSLIGPRFSTSFIARHDHNTSADASIMMQTDASVESNEKSRTSCKDDKENGKRDSKKSGLGCFYRSVFRIFVPNKKKEGAHYDEGDKFVENGIELRNLSQDEENIETILHENEQNKTSVDENEESDGYLPNMYSTTTNCKNNELRDFAREMLLSQTPGASSHCNPSCESPISLASAFRRSMSPSSSSCAGSECSFNETLINGNHRNTNVAQHVGWLKGHFKSPKAIEERRGDIRFFQLDF